MAKIFPRSLPNYVRTEPKSSAEVKVYDALRQLLGRGWTVFYHVAWLGRTWAEGEPRDGEADFVLGHPDLGVLLMEVKGGGVRYDGVAGGWWSRDRNGVEHGIRDPFEQAMTSKKVLLRKLKSLPEYRDQWLNFGHTVFLPDVSREVVQRANLPPHAEREVILTHEDLGAVATRLREVFRYWGPPGAGFAGDALMDDLERLLAPVTELPNPLKVQLADQEQEFLKLTEQQYKALDLLSRVRRASFYGCAGCGKTMLAVEKARRLAREGFHTLLTCRSEPLAQYLQALTDSTRRQTGRLDVFSFEKLCKQMAGAAQLLWQAAPTSRPDDEVRLYRHPELLEQAIARRPELRYDAVLVDEGQDFPEVWWIALDRCLNEGRDSVFYVFYDDNQRIYASAPNIPGDLLPFPLSENVRNTRAIHRQLAGFYKGDKNSLPAGPVGRTVEILPYPDAVGLRSELCRVLRRLIVTEGVAASDVVVLSPRPLDHSALPGMVCGDQIRLVTRGPQGRDVLCAGVVDFKGLESPVVVVAEVERDLLADPDLWTATCYIGFSRPRQHLIVLGHAEALSQLPSP